MAILVNFVRAMYSSVSESVILSSNNNLGNGSLPNIERVIGKFKSLFNVPEFFVLT